VQDITDSFSSEKYHPSKNSWTSNRIANVSLISKRME
jgi:hypothetical protein